MLNEMICFAWRYCFCEVVHAVRNSCMIAYYGAACDVDVNVLKESVGAFMIHGYEENFIVSSKSFNPQIALLTDACGVSLPLEHLFVVIVLSR